MEQQMNNKEFKVEFGEIEPFDAKDGTHLQTSNCALEHKELSGYATDDQNNYRIKEETGMYEVMAEKRIKTEQHFEVCDMKLEDIDKDKEGVEELDDMEYNCETEGKFEVYIVNMQEKSGCEIFDVTVEENSKAKEVIKVPDASLEKQQQKLHECSVCNKSFLFRRYLRDHLSIHSGKKPYQCSLCNKSFNQNRNLIRHLRTHTGEKPYQCNFCNKSFSANSSLTRHLRSHTGERPYRCNVCSKSFSDWSNLSYHKQNCTQRSSCATVEQNNDQKGDCKKDGTSLEDSVEAADTTQEQQRKQHECNLCEKSFISESRLTRHLRMHTGEKPYQCKLCTRMFSERSGVMRHLKLHTGERPYQCHLCSKSFAERSGLNRHFKLHTAE